MIVNFIERSIKKGNYLHIISALLRCGDVFLGVLPSSKYHRLVSTGRIEIEAKRGKFASVEKLLLRHAATHPMSLGLVQQYIRLINEGQAGRPGEIITSPQLEDAYRAMLVSAVHRSRGKIEEALAALEVSSNHFPVRKALAQYRRGLHHQNQDHEALSISVVDFLNAEPGRILIPFAMSAARAAETAHREDLFRQAVARIVDDINAVQSSRTLMRRHWKEAVAGSLSIFDIDGAIAISRQAKAMGLRAQKELSSTLEMRKDLIAIMHVVDEAKRDILERSGKRRSVSRSGDAVVIFPGAAVRSNKIDYPGFRSDIRFVLKSIVQALQQDGVNFTVRGRIQLHGTLDLDRPFFSYHTISDNRLGLHFKETDRPSLFSFDENGYAGWSEFSMTEVEHLPLAEVDSALAAQFFEADKNQMIISRQSKYTQSKNTGALPERFVFVGLQVLGDAVQSLAYTTPFAMVDEIVRTSKAAGISVVVKRHPACRSSQIATYLKEQEKLGNIVLVDGNIHDIIPASQAVCIVNSGLGAEALIYEKPVYVFGRADYMQGCFICENSGDFERQFVPNNKRLSSETFYKFWYLYRTRYACNLTEPEKARDLIAKRVRQHIDRVQADRVTGSRAHDLHLN